jgi:hypothetical protein
MSTNLAEMTFHTGSIVVIGTLGSVVALLFGIQQKTQEKRLTKVERKSDECEKHRNQLQDQLGEVKQRLGMADGTLRHVERCHVQECPMRGLTVTHSMRKLNQNPPKTTP